MVNRHIRLPLRIQQLAQGIIIILVRPIQISQLPGRIVPLPGNHEPLLLVLIEIARVELTGSVGVNGSVKPALFILVNVVFVTVAVQVQSGFEALPRGAVASWGVLAVVFVEGENGEDVFWGEFNVAFDAVVQSEIQS